jgi:AAA+ ATPase superfamily predicted ATPase
MEDVIGRTREKHLLNEALKSNKSELIAVSGRRRIGKTFLIREVYKESITFEITGLFKGNLKDQLGNFHKEIKKRTSKEIPQAVNWFEAFEQLEKLTSQKKSKKKQVLFIDEFPWMATPRSKFLMAFENFWNTFATKQKSLVVVICGSAASYMIQKIINNKGGLHNRISQHIRLEPFNLYETRAFLLSKHISYVPFDIAKLYMAIGGIPYYLDKVKRGRSVAQNIDALCFEKDGFLKEEFNRLFVSLFDNSERHLLIVKALAKKRKGITRKELIIASGISNGGDLSLKLDELMESGFVSLHTFHNNKKQNALYRLSDAYSLFYLKFIEKNKNSGKGTWLKLHTSRSYSSWAGFSFESLCLKHINQIKNALGILAVHTLSNSWFNEKAQIDVLIEREDNTINICEMKFSETPFTITKSYYDNLLNKKQQFLMDTKAEKTYSLPW